MARYHRRYQSRGVGHDRALQHIREAAELSR